MKTIAICIITLLSLGTLKAQSYINYAEGKPVTTSWESKNKVRLTDGSLVSGSFRKNPKGKSVTIDIDLTAEFKLGGLHMHIDKKGILPLREFNFQYKNGGMWIDIPGASRRDNFSSDIDIRFPKLISATHVRLVATNITTFGILEIQLWGRDVPSLPHAVEFEEPKPFETDKHWVCVNQVAYNLGAPKGFTVPTAKTDLPFVIQESARGDVVYKGKLKDGNGDFTDLNPKDSKSEYNIIVEGDDLKKGVSYPFTIGLHAIQEIAYQPSVWFFNDARSIMGSHPSAYGGTAWRDGTYYTYELPSMVLVYLSNPEKFDNMPIELSWQKDKDRALHPDFNYIKAYGDDNPLPVVKKIYKETPVPAENTPDIIQNILFGTAWNFVDPVSKDPSGDTLGHLMHGQTIEQLAYFLYGYPAYEKYISKGFYTVVLDSTLLWWKESGLFEVQTTVGNPKGRHCPGHSIMPNLLMYEVAKREKKDAQKFMDAAIAQTSWIIETADWNNPAFTKGQRMSEHKLPTGLAHFQYNYPEFAPKGLKQKITEWAEKAVSLSNNMWVFRKFAEDEWTLPGYNEAGNVIAFPGAALSIALVLEDGATKDRLVELAYSHFDNFNGRNPQNAHCANHPELGFEGVERGWPHGDPRRDICARLEHVRGSLSSLPGSEMYPFNPDGRPRHGEGWTAYNADWNVGIAFLNFFEGVSSISVLKTLK
ncbi:hypothetical protein SAMN05444274_101578 [Mariniphaga anaerophila]|uniref:F5/8 type C domain-containing protein n=1 Tax=Mariniphaga anaerophila TaxID=1484053 RepID=A0A1M4U5E6_9BACT|nr:hypothetical protein [Mariniphaga anaerophila]SHE51905.1 hypothetical protein SAMN05444274_101578 [Mariniphaga anaerophila]